MPAKFKATVAICTYNGASRVEAVFAALARQTLRPDDWEVLVIDNASTDRTAEFAQRLIVDLLGGHGRVVREDQPGLSHARACAAREARGEIICFLDDDNIPDPDFVAAAIRAFAQRPKAGVIGGKVVARWEVEPTPLVQTVAPFALAICDQGLHAELVQGVGSGIVGAGICVRTALLWEVYSQPGVAAQVTGRTGKNFMSGEDLVISIMARRLGWETWYVPTLQIHHCLPASRMDKKYLLRLYEGIGRGQAATRRVYDWKARTPLAWLIGLKDLARFTLGHLRGPSVESLQSYPDIAADLHDLHQRLVWGRAMQALS